MTPPPLALDNCLFLDIDGTLIEFTDKPSATVADPQIRALLAELTQRFGGAVALISGRALETIDALFAPQILPASGLHGAQRRSASGAVQGTNHIDARLDGLRAELMRLAVSYPGSLIEDKGCNIAVHFRMAPQSGPALLAAVAALAAPLESSHELQQGIMLVEIKPRGFNKGSPVRAFMDETPFAGRRPVFIGDDLTDRDGFAAVERLGGMSIGVGARVRGQYQLADVAGVRRWLGSAA